MKFDFGGEKIQAAEQALYVQTTDSYKGTKIQAPIKCSAQRVDGTQKKAEGERVYALDCAKIKTMVTMLQGDEVDIFLNEGQAIFINASRIFMFRAFEKSYPDISMLFAYKQSSIQIEVDSADVKCAAELIGIVCSTEESPIVLALEKEMLLLSDVKGKSENRIPAKISGELKEKIGMKKENLIEGLMNASSEKIRIFIGGSDKPIFIDGDKHDGTYFMVPVRLPSKHLETGSEKNQKNKRQ